MTAPADFRAPHLPSDPPTRINPLLSIDDVATYLGVSPRWVYSQVRSGRLPAMLIARSWRLRRDEVDDFAESFRSPDG
jgi:excisionase family DNA binding protein